MLEMRCLDVAGGEIGVCDYCKESPCFEGCPNAVYDVELYKCEECGEEIYVGETYLKVWRYGSIYRFHEDCGRSSLGIYELTNATPERNDYFHKKEEDRW